MSLIETHRRIAVEATVPATDGSGSWKITATVHVPYNVDSSPPVIAAFPGGSYNRRYYDLPEPGYSEAAAHAQCGIVTIAIDHLGSGDSSIPPGDVATLAVVASTNHAALQVILERLQAGSLNPDVGPIRPSVVVGAGQSIGGHAVVAMQAQHRSFDAVAVMGASMVCTTVSTPPGRAPAAIPNGVSAAEAVILNVLGADWPWLLHWEDVPKELVEADVGGGVPVRARAPVWGSMAVPAFAAVLLNPGAVAAEAAAIDVPVLVAMGTRDFCRPPLEELAAFTAARDAAIFVAPRMAHMHNFASTRETFWRRVEAFVAQVRCLHQSNV
jgi:alpha-beta hydrolase superfamily lysophospholipase